MVLQAQLSWHKNQTLLFESTAAVPGAWKIENGGKLPPPALRLYGNQALPINLIGHA